MNTRRDLSILKSLFSHITPHFPNILSSNSRDELRGIIKGFIKPYLESYRLEDVKLDEVLYAYNLRGGINVKIGLHNYELYYVIEEPNTSREIYEKAIDKVFNQLLRHENTVDLYNQVVWSLENPEDYAILRVTSGFGPLTPLILDPYIEDIYVSKKSRRVFIIHNKLSGVGWLKTNIILDPSLIDKLVISISRRIGKHVSLAYPIAEGTYEGRLRVSITYGDSVSTSGSSLVIRKKSSVVWTITRLIAEETIHPLIASYLWMVIEARGWIIIAGHVGAGKTTMLQALLTLIPPGRKVISIEDTPELTGSTGIWEQLVEKTDVFTRDSQIDSYTLLKFALRRRPDYIVIGEVRGIEARLLVQASRLGHGVLNTIHADSPDSVIERLMAPPISIPRNLLSNIWCIIVLGVDSRGKRRITHLAEVDDRSNTTPLLGNNTSINELENTLTKTSKLRKVHPEDILSEELKKRSLFLGRLVEKGIFELEPLIEELSRYYMKMPAEESETQEISGVP